MQKHCTGCNTTEKEKKAYVPYVVHESAVVRMERTIRRQWIALIITICMLFGSFAMFVWYESQFETVSYEYSQDGQGTKIIGDSNEVNNGAEIESENQEKAQ